MKNGRTIWLEVTEGGEETLGQDNKEYEKDAVTVAGKWLVLALRVGLS